MLLAIDVGNTHSVLGVYDADKLIHMWRISTKRHHTSDELRLKLRGLLHAADIELSSIDGMALASVVPQLTSAWSAVSCQLCGQEAVIANAQSAGSLFKSTYPFVSEIGADRIADAVAARDLYGAPCVVVDFGTATNIEVIDREGSFAGGIIAPGVETSAQALFSKAAKLSAIELVDPGCAIGRSSSQAVQAGIVYGEVDRVDGLVRRIFNELGYTAPVVATGGLTFRVAPLSQTITQTNSELTLWGLRLIFNESQRTPSDLA